MYKLERTDGARHALFNVLKVFSSSSGTQWGIVKSATYILAKLDFSRHCHC